MLLYAPPVLKCIGIYKASCLRSQVCSGRWPAIQWIGIGQYLKHCDGNVTPLTVLWCHVLARRHENNTNSINEAFVASSRGMVTDYSGLCLFKHYHVCILGVALVHVFIPKPSWYGPSRFSAWGLYDEYRQSTPNPEGAPAVMQHFLITASASRRIANAVSCVLETVTMFWFWTHLSHGLAKASHMDWQELCARVSYLSHSAQIQIFHNISMLAM